MNRFFGLLIGVSILAIALSTNLSAAEKAKPPSQENEKSIHELDKRIIRLETIIKEIKESVQLSNSRIQDLEKVKSSQAALRERIEAKPDKFDIYIILTVVLGTFVAVFSFFGISLRSSINKIKDEATNALEEIKTIKKESKKLHDEATDTLKKIKEVRIKSIQESGIIHSLAEKADKAKPGVDITESETKEIKLMLSQYKNQSDELASLRSGLSSLVKFKEEAKSRLEKQAAEMEEIGKLADITNEQLPSSHFLNLAYNLAKLGKNKEAIEKFSIAIKLKPDFALTYYNRGVLYGETGKNDMALADQNKAIELEPAFAYPYNSRGAIFASEEKNEKAFWDFNKSIELQPDYPFPYYNRGLVYYSTGETEKAFKDYNKAIELKPDYVDAYINRGLLFAKTGDIEKAFKDTNKAIELKPDYAVAYISRGDLYKNKEKNEEALNDVNQAIKLKPDYAEAYNLRGLIYYNTGKTEKAFKDINKTIELKPDYAGAYQNRAELQITEKMFDDAENQLKNNIRVFRKTNDKLTGLYLLRMAIIGQGKPGDKEEKEYRSILADNPTVRHEMWDFSIIDKFLKEEETKQDIPENRLKKMRELTEEFKKLQKDS